MSKQTKPDAPEMKAERLFLGVFVDKDLKDELKRISKAERRSVNRQVELFLELGVAHLKEQLQKKAA